MSLVHVVWAAGRTPNDTGQRGLERGKPLVGRRNETDDVKIHEIRTPRQAGILRDPHHIQRRFASQFGAETVSRRGLYMERMCKRALQLYVMPWKPQAPSISNSAKMAKGSFVDAGNSAIRGPGWDRVA